MVVLSSTVWASLLYLDMKPEIIPWTSSYSSKGITLLAQSLFKFSEDIFDFDVPWVARRSSAAKIMPKYCLSPLYCLKDFEEFS